MLVSCAYQQKGYYSRSTKSQIRAVTGNEVENCENRGTQADAVINRIGPRDDKAKRKKTIAAYNEKKPELEITDHHETLE